MIVWIAITKKVKINGLLTFREDAQWLLTDNIIKNKKDAKIYFLDSYSWYSEKHIKTIKRIKI